MGESPKCEPWARGLLLLQRLKAHGVVASDVNVARALRSRLWVLFGPGVSRRRINMEAIRRNRHDLRHYVEHANSVWGRPLFNVPTDVLEDDAQLLVAVFGKVRSTDKKAGQYVDVVDWAAAKARSAYHDAPTTLRGRHYTWKHSPFKFSDRLSHAKGRILRSRKQRQEASDQQQISSSKRNKEIGQSFASGAKLGKA